MALALTKPARKAPDDVALIAQAIAGDERALTALYRAHSAYVAGVVYRMLGSDADLDDIVQETFVDGLRGLGSLEDPTKLRAFLVTIAVRRIHRRLSFRYRMKSMVANLFGGAPTVSDPATRAEVHELYEKLGRVDPKKRVAWVLHRVEGFTLPEVAEQTGASLATVKRWVASVDQGVDAGVDPRVDARVDTDQKQSQAELEVEVESSHEAR